MASWTSLVVATCVVSALLLLTADAAPPFEYPTIAQLSTTTVTTTPQVPYMASALSTTPPVGKPLQISSTFGPRWKASDSRDDFHRGVDYFDDAGAPVFAVQDGVVFQIHTEASGTMPGGGNVVVLRHDFTQFSSHRFHDRNITTYFSYYLHLLAIASSLAVDQVVTKGQHVGYMGKSGDTSFVHLHFETRLQGYCSMEFQVANNRVPSPSSFCNTGFDPHIHPYVIVGGVHSGPKTLWSIEPRPGYTFALRYNTTRGHLDFDVIKTDFGVVGFNTREGVKTSTTEQLDDIASITSYLSLRPGYFVSTTADSISYELHFKAKPSFVELYDVLGSGIRWSAAADAGSGARCATVTVVLFAVLLLL